jgi:hypothetical protein
MSEIKPIPPEIGKRYLAAWASADAFLTEEKLARLRAMTDDEAREIMHAILAFPLPTDMPERVCGLVEQQKWFRKLHKQK